jgi:hypothetical protein
MFQLIGNPVRWYREMKPAIDFSGYAKFGFREPVGIQNETTGGWNSVPAHG